MPCDLMGNFMFTVYCRSDGPHFPRCDGWFCTCWCHEGWRDALRKTLANRPVGVL